MPGISERLPPAVIHSVWQKGSVDGLTILIVEDEPLIRLELEQALEAAGARVLSANGSETARHYVESPDLSAAVLDWIDDGICRRLTERGVPFVFYSGHETSAFGDWQHVTLVAKPASPRDIIAAVESLL